jgi:hypothetical protein
VPRHERDRDQSDEPETEDREQVLHSRRRVGTPGIHERETKQDHDADRLSTQNVIGRKFPEYIAGMRLSGGLEPGITTSVIVQPYRKAQNAVRPRM